MNVNWIVRIKNKNFWISLIPALLLFAQLAAKLFGYELDFGDVGNTLLAIVDVVFVILTLLGLVNDPTTAGLSDSTRAQTYDEPYKSRR